MRNDSAAALVGRADLCHRLSAAVPVESGEELEEARVFGDQLTALLQTHEDGCCTHVVLENGVRTINFHVHAQSIQENSERPVTLDMAFDPTWNSYRTWVS